MDLETTVKLRIYETIAATTHPPTSEDLARELGVSAETVEAEFESLHRKRLLVPEPGDPSRIRMAPPFSGIATAFRVNIDRRAYYANCVWDAYGIAAALHAETADVEASDGHTGERLNLTIRGGRPLPAPYVAHFAVPAAKWWADIVHT